MKKQELTGKNISELRTMAKKAGITAKSNWKKEDFIKAISKEKPAKKKTEKKAAKPSKKKAPTKKTAAKKTAAKAKPQKPEKKTKKKIEVKKAKAPAKAKIKAPVKLKAKAPSKVKAKTPEKKTAKKAVKKATPKLIKKEIEAPLEKLTVAELKTLAKELNIPLKSGFKKADIIKAISKAKVKTEKPVPKKAKRAEAPKPAPAKKEKEAVKKVTAAKKRVVISEILPKALKKIPEKLKKTPKAPEEPVKYLVPEEMPLLPIGYGENKLASMPVTPSQIYVYWEITEDTISQYRGSLNLKIVNSKTNAFFYLPLSERIGEHFINVRPAAEYNVEIGVINYKGEFVKILHALPVETPVSGVSSREAPSAGAEEAAELPEEFFETPESISSY